MAISMGLDVEGVSYHLGNIRPNFRYSTSCGWDNPSTFSRSLLGVIVYGVGYWLLNQRASPALAEVGILWRN